MKLYNRGLEEIENNDRYNRVDGIIRKQIEFLTETYGIDEEKLQDKLNSLAIIERLSRDKTYFIEVNGEKQELINSSSVAAFVTMKSQTFDGTKWNFENGVYMSDTNSDHKVAHELFHFLSKKQQMSFNESGVGYTKTGTLIVGYDREEKVVDRSLRAEGLNEGITELLAAKMDGIEPNSYEFQAYLSDILINNQHTSLLEGYFSEDEKDFQKFLEEFDRQQSTVSSERLLNLSKDGQVVADAELLKGSLEYTLSFCNNIDELESERKRLVSILQDMSESLNIEFDMEQFDIKSFFKDIFMEKRQVIEDRTSKKLIDSAIVATETRIKSIDIEEHQKRVEQFSLENNKNYNQIK